MLDALREIIATIKKNKLRTLLTGFAVAWGIFMLIILLAAGNGFKNGVFANFEDQAKTYVIVNPGRTSKPYKGFSTGRRIRLDQRDFDMLRNEVPEIEHLSAGIGNTLTASYGEEYLSMEMQGGTASLQHINNIRIKEGLGRFINQVDEQQRRKVVVIHPEQQKVLFKNENPIGKHLNINGIIYQVIGVYGSSDEFYNNMPPAYIPLSTAQMLYNRGYGFWFLEFTVNGLHSMAQNEAFNERLRQKFGRLHHFDPSDRSAIYLWNAAQEALEIQKVFGIINIFLIVIGLASMMAGIVGVGNIMAIVVKERTREIGIRKAIGASPASVLRLVMFESLFVTLCAGYVGIVLGVGVTELANFLIQSAATEEENFTMFMDPTVNMGVVLLATGILVAAGVLAGLVPAQRATKIKPIEAMRAE
jgi:ABC-type antimicrobial peptide transport system, permease component